MIPVLAMVRGEDPPALLDGLLELGLEAVLCEGPSPLGVAHAAAQRGLAVEALLAESGPDPADGLEGAARELGARLILRLDRDPRLLRLGGAGAIDALLACQPRPEVVAWAGPGGEDPGVDFDEELAELAAHLREEGFEGALALRAGDLGRLAALHRLVTEVLSEGASWWDGTEDGY